MKYLLYIPTSTPIYFSVLGFHTIDILEYQRAKISVVNQFVPFDYHEIIMEICRKGFSYYFYERNNLLNIALTPDNFEWVEK